MGRKTFDRTYVCDLPFPLVADPCTGGGPNHDPMPTGYGSRFEYAAQLLSTGWVQHRCPACGLWALWRPLHPQPLPPPRPAPGGGVWELPEAPPACRDCNPDDDWDTPDRDWVTDHQHAPVTAAVLTLTPNARYL